MLFCSLNRNISQLFHNVGNIYLFCICSTWKYLYFKDQNNKNVFLAFNRHWWFYLIECQYFDCLGSRPLSLHPFSLLQKADNVTPTRDSREMLVLNFSSVYLLLHKIIRLEILSSHKALHNRAKLHIAPRRKRDSRARSTRVYKYTLPHCLHCGQSVQKDSTGSDRDDA